MPELVWVENASTDSQALLEGVADGTIDYTIADSTEFALAHDAHPDLRIAFDFPGDQSLAWAASARDPEFSDGHERLFRTPVPKRRAGDHRQPLLRPLRGSRIRRAPKASCCICKVACRSTRNGSKKPREQSSQDWRLLAAIGYQESKWNPQRRLGDPAPWG